MSDVFISYSRKDKEFVHILHDALEKTQKNTWVDWEDILPTSEWWQEIESAIAGSDTFIFVITPTSIASEYCNKEVEYAYNLHKRILPIVRQDVADITEVHPALSRHQWIFFRESDDFDTAFQRLREALNLDIDRIHAHTRLLVRAIDWDSKQRKESFLLRGEDLAEAEKWLAESVGKSPKPTEPQVTYIEVSRKVEDANQQLIQMLKEAAEMAELRIQEVREKTNQEIHQVLKVRNKAFVIAGIVVCVCIGVSISAYYLITKDLELAYERKVTLIQEKFKDLELAYERKVTLINKENLKYILDKRNTITETNQNCKAVIDTSQSNGNGVIYIQVPSEAVKTKIQDLPNTLTKLGYKAFKAEVVGLTISPNSSQIRYFFNDEKTKERAYRLQQQLNDLGYKEFEPKQVKYVKGFEGKVKPEMMEIWFGKDAK